MKTLYTLLFLLLLQNWAFAQNPYRLVLLADKNGSNYSVENPSEFLTQKAIERREKQAIPITENDLPVIAEYIRQIKETGAEISYSSKWLNAVLVNADAQIFEEIETLPFVTSTALLSDRADTFFQIPNSIKSNSAYTEGITTEFQNDLLGIPYMHNDGFKGEGIEIAVFDGGFLHSNWDTYFGHIHITDQHNFIENNTDVFQYHVHGYSVMSTIASYKENEMIGTAYNANFSLYVTEDVSQETRLEEFYWLFAAERADSAGIDIINSSLGYYDFDDTAQNYTHEELDGQTSWISLAANYASAKGMLVVTSAGNEGNYAWEKITFPADSPVVLAVGAVDRNENIAYFSSLGPTADEQTKPDIVALGQGSTVLNSSSTPSYGNGTSYSAPQIAGLAAGLWQKYPELTNLELIALIKNLGDNREEPNNTVGWGIPSYTETLVSNELPLEEITISPTLVEDGYTEIQNIPSDCKKLTCRFYNIEGKEIKQLDFDNPKKNITIQAPEKEQLYFLHLNSNKQFKVFRVFKR